MHEACFATVLGKSALRGSAMIRGFLHKLLINMKDTSFKEKQLAQLKNDYPTESVNYIFDQWWADGQRERWAEIHICKNVNLEINTTSRVEGSHGAMKASGTFYTAGSKINVRVQGSFRTTQYPQLERKLDYMHWSLYIQKSSRNSFVKAMNRTTNAAVQLGTVTYFRIPLGMSLYITDIHPGWGVHPVFPPLNVPWQQVDSDRLAVLKDPSVELPRKGRPRGTRRLKTQLRSSNTPLTKWRK
ncbi:hypothetical protein V1527DRAFT_503930 [Lipomyces starkeyi]